MDINTAAPVITRDEMGDDRPIRRQVSFGASRCR